MGLYLGSSKVQIILDEEIRRLNFYTSTLITNGTLLISSDGYILLDSNGLYLTAKESE